MPTTAHKVDVTDLGFETRAGPNTVDVEVDRQSSKTIVEVTHGSETWTLIFGEKGRIEDRKPAPPTRPPQWLGPVVKETDASLSLK